MAAELDMRWMKENGTVAPQVGGSVVFTSALAVEAEPAVGDVLRRTCAVIGDSACQKVCLLDTLSNVAGTLAENPTGCSDKNLLWALEGMGTSPEKALMIGVTADKVGFLDDDGMQEAMKQNPNEWWELPGFNAFFARDTDTLPGGADTAGEQIEMIGARLADCGFIVVSMKDAEGNNVRGLVHRTRTNLPGKDYRKAYQEGREPENFLTYAVRTAMERYGAAPEDVSLQVVAAVGPEGWRKKFSNTEESTGDEKLRKVLPGWVEDGLIKYEDGSTMWPWDSAVDPDGQPYTLYPEYRQKVVEETYETAAQLGIPTVVAEQILDPSDAPDGKVHSSANRKHIQGHTQDSRDLYAVVF